MKKILAILILCTTLFVGCNKNKAYDDAISLGREALSNSKYDVALEHFDLALKEKNNDEEASTLYNQTNNYLNALSQYDKYKYDKALESLNSVANEPEGSDYLVKESINLREKIESEKDLYNKIKESSISSQNHFENKKYELAIKDIDASLELIGDNKKFITEKDTLENLKNNCIKNIEQIKKQAEKKAEEEPKSIVNTNNSNTSISESQAIKILQNYISQQTGYIPNTIELYETVNGKYHLNASHYENDDTRATFGWFWIDSITGDVSR